MQLEDGPWFVAKDVCLAIGLEANPAAHLQGAPRNEMKVLRRDSIGTSYSLVGLFPPRSQAVTLISEPLLYRLALRAQHSPEARAFQDWVVRDVLPAIRKDGAYVMGEEKVATGEMDDL